MNSVKYLVWSNEHSAWWRPNSAGYTIYMKSAGRYTKEEAEKCCDTRSNIPGNIPPEIMMTEDEAYKNLGLPSIYNALKYQLEYLQSQSNSQRALIQKIMDIVEKTFPGQRHSDYDVLHQGVQLLASEYVEMFLQLGGLQSCIREELNLDKTPLTADDVRPILKEYAEYKWRLEDLDK